MAKQFRYLLVFGLILPFVYQCRGVRDSDPPISKICNYNGSNSGNTVKLVCTGIGESHDLAFRDAKKAAIFFVASKMLETSASRQRFSFQQRNFYARYNSFLATARTDKTITQNDEDKYMVKAFIQVNRTEIVRFLKDFGIANPRAIRKKIGNPSVAITTTWKAKGAHWRAQIRRAANEYFTARSYNAVDLTSGMKNLRAMQQKVLSLDGVPGDKRFRAAQMMGADVYFELAVWNDTKGAHTKGSASIKAYETTTGRLLGSSTGFGERYPIAMAQSEFKTAKEAVQNTMEKVLVHVNRYWTQDASTGNRYSLLIAGQLNAVEDMGDLLTLRIKKMAGISEFKRTTSTSNRLTITFKSKMDQTEMSLMLKQTIRKSPGVRSMRVPLTTRKTFVVLVNTSGGGDSLPPGL